MVVGNSLDDWSVSKVWVMRVLFHEVWLTMAKLSLENIFNLGMNSR